MDATAIGAIFTGLATIITGLAALTAARQRRVAEDQRVLRRQVRQLQRQVIATVEHIFALEMILAQHGIARPERPAILEAAPDEDDEPPARSAADPSADRRGGRHAAGA